jgi:mRNA interferase MazF
MCLTFFEQVGTIYFFLSINYKMVKTGLNEPCDIMIDQVHAIDNKKLIKKVGLPPAEMLEKIKWNLKIVFDLE